MKLGVIAGEVSGWTGGINYILNMCRVLKAETDIEPVVLVPGHVPDDLAIRIARSSGNPLLSLPPASLPHRLRGIAGLPDHHVLQALREAGCDAVFEAAGFHLLPGGPPVLSWIPDFQHRHLPSLFSRHVRMAREVRFRNILRRREHVLLSSQDARADQARFYPRGRAEIHVVPFAIALESLPGQTEIDAALARHGIEGDYIFLPNQFWQHKNHALVLEALKLPGAEEVPPIIASGNPHNPKDPEWFGKLNSLIHQSKLEQRFRLVGHLPYSEILALNAGCKALLNPSRFEGWSTTVEEAKALGTPLILSGLGVHREQSGDNAIYFDHANPASCLAALRQASGLIRQRVGEGQEARIRLYAERLRNAVESML